MHRRQFPRQWRGFPPIEMRITKGQREIPGKKMKAPAHLPAEREWHIHGLYGSAPASRRKLIGSKKRSL